jgi:hypothetical protein
VSVVAALLVGICVVVAAGDHRAGLSWLGALAVVVLVGGIAFSSSLAIGAAIAALGIACVIAEMPAAPFVALILFVAAEAAFWSVDDRLRFTETAGPRRDRLVLVAVIGASALTVGALLRQFTRDAAGGGRAYSVVAGVSLTALAVLIAVGVRRLPSRTR